jgi:hypothetical protein
VFCAQQQPTTSSEPIAIWIYIVIAIVSCLIVLTIVGIIVFLRRTNPNNGNHQFIATFVANKILLLDQESRDISLQTTEIIQQPSSDNCKFILYSFFSQFFLKQIICCLTRLDQKLTLSVEDNCKISQSYCYVTLKSFCCF